MKIKEFYNLEIDPYYKGWVTPNGEIKIFDAYSEHVANIPGKRGLPKYSEDENKYQKILNKEMANALKKGYVRFALLHNEVVIQYDERADGGSKNALKALNYMQPDPNSIFLITNRPWIFGNSLSKEKEFTSASKARAFILQNKNSLKKKITEEIDDKNGNKFKGWMSPKGKINLFDPFDEHYRNIPFDIEKAKHNFDDLKLALNRGYCRFGCYNNICFVHYDKNSKYGINSAIAAIKFINPENNSTIHITALPWDKKYHDVTFKSKAAAINYIKGTAQVTESTYDDEYNGGYDDGYDDEEYKGWIKPNGDVIIFNSFREHAENIPGMKNQLSYKDPKYDNYDEYVWLEDRNAALRTAMKKGYVRFGLFGYEAIIHFDKSSLIGIKNAKKVLKVIKIKPGMVIIITSSPWGKQFPKEKICKSAAEVYNFLTSLEQKKKKLSESNVGTLQADVRRALPATYNLTDLNNSDPYKQYRMGLALASARANTNDNTNDNPLFSTESTFAENMIISAYTKEDEETIKLALKLLGKWNNYKLISTRPSEEAVDVNTKSPIVKYSKRKI